MKVIIYDSFCDKLLFASGEVIQKNLACIWSAGYHWRLFWVKVNTIYAILNKTISTGVFITCGRVALKFLLNKAHRHIMPLWEHVPSWSGFEYDAATITPVAFQETSDTSNFSSEAKSKFSKVATSLDYLLKKIASSSFPYPLLMWWYSDKLACSHSSLLQPKAKFSSRISSVFLRLLLITIPLLTLSHHFHLIIPSFDDVSWEEKMRVNLF